MKVSVAFHNVDRSDALVSFIEKKSHQVKKLLWPGEELCWVVEHSAKQFEPKAKLILKNKVIDVSAKAGDVFSAVNLVIERAKRVIRDDHRKLKNL
ncbi:MAG: hypothetical protein HON90_15180 [Halobacteriovoraceae bacterium]|jgi:ribosome-associated translation inhibitor RaiA|nr:hypothetical protein [Halobacteriovoraceae bacterium]